MSKLMKFEQTDTSIEGQENYKFSQYASNNPVLNIDLDGLESINALMYSSAVEKSKLTKQESRNYDKRVAGSVASMTDLNDFTVLTTMFTRGGNAVNLDGTKASTTDKVFAAAGIAIPFVAGAVIENAVEEVFEIIIDAKKYPESAKHLDEAIAAGKQNEGVIDRSSSAARRRENLKGEKTQPGKDRDEAPPAVINTGEKSSVKSIDASDNRGADSSIGKQIKNLPNGTKVKIVSKTTQ